MAALTERLQEVMAAMRWQHADLVRVSRQSSSVVSQWLGRGSKDIKTIGKLEAAIYIERETGFSALWVAKGIGPKRAQQTTCLSVAHSAHGQQGGEALALVQMGKLLQRVPPAMRNAFADVLSGWAASGGTDDRLPALLALLRPADPIAAAAVHCEAAQSAQ